MAAPPELSEALNAAQQDVRRGDPLAAFNRLEDLPTVHRTGGVLRLQTLCLGLLNREQEALELAAKAETLHPKQPLRLLQTADLAWYRKEYWTALLTYLQAMQQQPKLHNLWPRILKCAALLKAASASDQGQADTAGSRLAKLRQLLVAMVEQLLAQPTNPQLLHRLAHLLPLLPSDPAQPDHHSTLSQHCRHALAALEAVEAIDAQPAGE
jgi:hypothetical protein